MKRYSYSKNFSILPQNNTKLLICFLSCLGFYHRLLVRIVRKFFCCRLQDSPGMGQFSAKLIFHEIWYMSSNQIARGLDGIRSWHSRALLVCHPDTLTSRISGPVGILYNQPLSKLSISCSSYPLHRRSRCFTAQALSVFCARMVVLVFEQLPILRALLLTILYA